MKQFIILLLALVIAINANAQVRVYKAEYFSIATFNNHSQKYEWDDWEECDIKITIDFSEDIVEIYSQYIQTYNILSKKEDKDRRNKPYLYCKAVDKEGNKCALKFINTDGDNFQMYIFYNDIAWAYDF